MLAAVCSDMSPAAVGSHALQIVKMQEDPTNIPEGETPRSLLMYAFDTNVDACKPGDRITVTGTAPCPAS
jgi:DNA replicative helicase MCM subunit Mcm2 (Cdc46/Mcm family)